MRTGRAQRFGFITTNSIHQTFNRRVLEQHLTADKTPLTLAYASPDHPWVDSTDGAAVRIAMTVATADPVLGELNRVTEETEIEDGEHRVELDIDFGKIAANLKVGADLGSSFPLSANRELSNRGVQVIGDGFILTQNEVTRLDQNRTYRDAGLVRGYLNRRDFMQTSRGVLVVDFFELPENEARTKAPELYQHLLTTVKPVRDQNSRASYRRLWWIHGEPRRELRKSLVGITRFIATVETSKHRVFVFLDQSILPDNKLINFATSDAFYLGAMSSTIHVTWALACGGRLGVGNDPVYVKTRCFETFPFPDLPESNPLQAQIRDLGEQLDAHRKRQQAAHADLTLTGLYNVVEKLRREEALTPKERKLHDDGLAAVVKQLHDELDAAVLAAYGWTDLATSVPLADRLARGDEVLEQALLTRLVALNHTRAAEEARGHIRWLRPEYQNPGGVAAPQADQGELDVTAPAVGVSAKQPWPKTLPDQVTALRALLPTHGPDAPALAATFGKRTPKRIAEITEILTTLHNLGQL